MRHRGDEVHLLSCQLLGSPCIDHHEARTGRQNAQDAEAQEQIAAAGLRHGRAQ